MNQNTPDNIGYIGYIGADDQTLTTIPAPSGDASQVNVLDGGGGSDDRCSTLGSDSSSSWDLYGGSSGNDVFGLPF